MVNDWIDVDGDRSAAPAGRLQAEPRSRHPRYTTMRDSTANTIRWDSIEPEVGEPWLRPSRPSLPSAKIDSRCGPTPWACDITRPSRSQVISTHRARSSSPGTRRGTLRSVREHPR
jgi:hypothetical protein